MKISARSFRFFASSVLATATVIAALGATSGTASAAKPKPPTPTPTVSAPVNDAQVILVRPDLVQIQVSPAGRYQDAQLLSGPNSIGRPVIRSIAGFISFNGLVANSDYVYQVRNIDVGRAPSAWAQFTFRTVAQFDTRPNPPQNLRETNRTATTVTVQWNSAPSTSYEASVNGIPINAGCSIYCADSELASRTFALPAPGTSSTFNVAARDVNFNLSLPATLVITN